MSQFWANKLKKKDSVLVARNQITWSIRFLFSLVQKYFTAHFNQNLSSYSEKEPKWLVGWCAGWLNWSVGWLGLAAGFQQYFGYIPAPWYS